MEVFVRTMAIQVNSPDFDVTSTNSEEPRMIATTPQSMAGEVQTILEEIR